MTEGNSPPRLVYCIMPLDDGFCVDLISFVYDTENNHFPPSRSIVLFVFFFSTTKLEGENQ